MGPVWRLLSGSAALGFEYFLKEDQPPLLFLFSRQHAPTLRIMASLIDHTACTWTHPVPRANTAPCIFESFKGFVLLPLWERSTADIC